MDRFMKAKRLNLWSKILMWRLNYWPKLSVLRFKNPFRSIYIWIWFQIRLILRWNTCRTLRSYSFSVRVTGRIRNLAPKILFCWTILKRINKNKRKGKLNINKFAKWESVTILSNFSLWPTKLWIFQLVFLQVF